MFKEIVDGRTNARKDDGRRTLKDHKSQQKGFLAKIKSHPIFIIIGIPGVLGILYSEAKRV